MGMGMGGRGTQGQPGLLQFLDQPASASGMNASSYGGGSANAYGGGSGGGASHPPAVGAAPASPSTTHTSALEADAGSSGGSNGSGGKGGGTIDLDGLLDTLGNVKQARVHTGQSHTESYTPPCAGLVLC
jgi:hypothetical protein